NPAWQYPVIRRDDDAIRAALDDHPLDTFDAEIGMYWYIQGTGTFDDLIVSPRTRPDEAGDPESCRQRFQGAQGGGTHTEQQNAIHDSPYRCTDLEYLDVGKVLLRCPVETLCQHLADFEPP